MCFDSNLTAICVQCLNEQLVSIGYNGLAPNKRSHYPNQMALFTDAYMRHSASVTQNSKVIDLGDISSLIMKSSTISVWKYIAITLSVVLRSMCIVLQSLNKESLRGSEGLFVSVGCALSETRS